MVITKKNKMKKIILTENQLNMVKKYVNEGAMGGDRYERSVTVYVETYGVKINGEDIDWATCGDMKLSFLIEMEHKSWGIRDISLYDIQGPSEIEIEVTPQVEDAEDVYLNLPFDWSNVEKETETEEGVITIGNEITIKLGNNENGEVIIESINVPVYTL
jgi:hypothetical protein